MNTAALSSVLFKNGQACGACFEIKCADSPQWCKLGQSSLFVTATDHCPPNPSLPNDNGGWCNVPREHFDVAKPVFSQLAEYKAGIIPIHYRRSYDFSISYHLAILYQLAGQLGCLGRVS